ncbi:MAG: DUF2339 domain-containing protein [Armatimonadetes bacterium]|nr:DUF2339 domain-containing protein [Armatimonadota bacterium]
MSMHRSQEPVQEFLERLSQKIDDLARRLDSLERHVGVRPDFPAAPSGSESQGKAPPPPLEAPPQPLDSQPGAPPPPVVPSYSYAPEPSAQPMPAEPSVPPPPIIPPPPTVPDSKPPAPIPVPLSLGSSSTAGPEARATLGGATFESVVGGKWTLWAGSVFVFLAVALFLQWAWQWIGPAGRLAVGFVAGSVFVGGAALAAHRQQKWFAEGLTGTGLAIYYLSIWAGAHVYGLFPFQTAFVLMAIVTAFGVVLAVRYDAISLCLLATLGGFLTPAVLTSASSSPSSPLPLLTYVAVLNAGIVGVSVFKRWRGAIQLAFISTLVLVAGWALLDYRQAMVWPIFAYLTLFELEFAGAACLYSLWRRERTPPADLALLFAASFFYGMFGLSVLEPRLGNYPGAFPLLAGVAFGASAALVRAISRQDLALQRSLIGLALFYITIALPVQLSQMWLAVGWSLESALLLTMSHALHSRLFRRSAQFVWAISLVVVLTLVSWTSPDPLVPFANTQALPLLVSILAGAWMAVTEGRSADPGHKTTFYLLSVVTIGETAWLLALESSVTAVAYPALFPSDRWAVTLFLTAILWAILSICLEALGGVVRQPFVRGCGLVVAVLGSALPVAGSLTQLDSAVWSPFTNIRAASFLVTSALLGWLSWRWARTPDSEAAETSAWTLGLLSVVGLIGLSIEVYSGGVVWSNATGARAVAEGVYALCALWAAFAVGMLLLSLKWRHVLFGIISIAVAFLAVFLLLAVSLDSPTYGPIWNIRFVVFVWCSAAAAFGAYVVQRKSASAEASASSLIGLLALGLLIGGLTQETYEAFRFYQSLFPDWELAAQMAISLVWTVSAVVLLLIGAHWKQRLLRIVALGILGLTSCKLFLLDLSFLQGGYRVVSFAGLGVALIGISWLYSHYEIGAPAAKATESAHG